MHDDDDENIEWTRNNDDGVSNIKNSVRGLTARNASCSQSVLLSKYQMLLTENVLRISSAKKFLTMLHFVYARNFGWYLRKRGSGTSNQHPFKHKNERNEKEHHAKKKEKEIEGLYFILRLFMADIRNISNM